jgi:hypothetical protein
MDTYTYELTQIGGNMHMFSRNNCPLNSKQQVNNLMKQPIWLSQSMYVQLQPKTRFYYVDKFVLLRSFLNKQL